MGDGHVRAACLHVAAHHHDTYRKHQGGRMMRAKSSSSSSSRVLYVCVCRYCIVLLAEEGQLWFEVPHCNCTYSSSCAALVLIVQWACGQAAVTQWQKFGVLSKRFENVTSCKRKSPALDATLELEG